MDRTITASEAGARFAELLKEVRGGDTVTVTEDGRAVATLSPAASAVTATEARDEDKALLAYLEELKQRPVQHIGPWTREELYERDLKA